MKVPSPQTLGLPEKFDKWRVTQEQAFCQIKSSLQTKRTAAACLPTGCHESGQKILMFDGSLRDVEDIEVGDALMGVDDTPRFVTSLIRGRAQMYQITPTKGEPFIVNGDHVLSLKLTNDYPGRSGRTRLVSVLGYLGWAKSAKHIHKLYRSIEVNFPKLKTPPVDPYFLGTLLGDGSLRGSPAVHSIDPEIIQEARKQAEIWGLRIRTHKIGYYLHAERGEGNPLNIALRSLGLINHNSDDKFVPASYKRGSVTTRLETIAGLLDTDGYLQSGCFDFISKSRQLSYDLAYMCRSVGLAAYVALSEKTCQTGAGGLYYRVSISGDTYRIPCRIPRKKAALREQKKDVLRTGFRIEPTDVDYFYGFTLTDDGLYHLGDFTITHNSGKSPLAVGLAIDSGEPTAIVTNSRGLQTQYEAEFSSCGMVDLRGRSNYECQMRPEYSCEEGGAARCPYKGSVTCPASQAEMRAASSSLVVTNYAKWIAAKRHGNGLNHIKRVIFDEGHECPGALARALQVDLHHREIEEVIGQRFLRGAATEDFNNWRSWAAVAKEAADLRAIILKSNKIEGVVHPKPTHVKQYNHLVNLIRRLGILATARPQDWVAEEIPDYGWRFDPVWPGRYAESTLLLKVPKIIVMSATLRPKTLYMTGIPKGLFDFFEYDSEFDPKRCPIYHIPTQRVDYRNPDMSMVWLRIDQIMARRRGRKGIIHTVSFQRQKDLLANSRFAEVMMVNEKGEPPSEVIDAFKAEPAGSSRTLVSPSVGTGYDFPDDQCRFQILCKIPFEPPSKILKAREERDKEYRSYNAMQTMVQAFGRGTRAKSDWSESFIPDDNVEWFVPKYRYLAPKWFNGFFKTVNVLPPPLNL